MRRIGSRPPRRAIQAPRAWSPLDLSEKLKIWLTADYGITLVSGLVASWASRVGTYVVSQSVASSRPYHYPGNPAVVEFDGIDDFLTGTTNLDAHLSTPPSKLEVWSVVTFEHVDLGSGFYGSAIARTQSSNRFSLVASPEEARFAVLSASSTAVFASSHPPDLSLFVRMRGSVGMPGGLQRCKAGYYAEGTTTSAGQHSGNYGFPLRIARDDDTPPRHLAGNIRHVFVFNDELTDEERDRLDAWLVQDCGAQV